MPKTKISEFSATPANNTDIDSINIAEGCAPSGINDAIRELMAQLKDFQTGAVGDSFNGPIGTSTAAAGAFTTLSASSTTTLSGLTASTALALDASKNVVSVTNTGTGNNVLATSPTLVTPILGTPTSATLTNATGLPISTGVSGLGTGVATALAVNVGSAGAPLVNGGVLGTPSSGTATNLTGLPLTTGVTGTLPTANGGTNLTSFTSGGVVYASSTSALATGSALNFNGTSLAIGDTAASADGSSFYVYGNVPASTQLGIKIGGNANSYTQQAIRFYDTYFGAYAGYIGFTTNALTFGSGTTEGLRLTSTSLYTASGINVGFGTSSPAKKLDLTNGDFRMTDGYTISWGDDGYRIFRNGTMLRFDTNGSERMRIPAAGGVQAVTTISVGNATPTTSGAGITFPATQSPSSNANTLDDYEEGTYNPADISGAGLTLTNNTSYYIKIGNMVFFTADVTYPTTASTSIMLISLPFPTSFDAGGSIGYTTYVPANPTFVQISGGANGIRLQSNGGTTVTNIAMSTLRIQISGCYTA